MNDEYDQSTKAHATDQLADEWAKQPMLNRHTQVGLLFLFFNVPFHSYLSIECNCND